MGSFLEIRNLKRMFKDLCALDVEHLDVESGQIVSLVGTNGSGKTTLLNLLGLIDLPSEGVIRINGEDLAVAGDKRSEYRRRVTLVSQNPYMFSGSVAKNISFGLSLRGIGEYERSKRVADVLCSVGLEGFEGRTASALSAGETMRVAIARALSLRPEFLLLDEPLSNVDKNKRGLIEKAIEQIRNVEHTTVVVATHDLDFGTRVADKVLSLEDGRIKDLPETSSQSDASPEES